MGGATDAGDNGSLGGWFVDFGSAILCWDCREVFDEGCPGFLFFINFFNRLIGLVGRVLANDPEDLGSIPGRILPKTFKMGLDTSLLNTQQFKVRIKDKVEQSRERSSALPYTSV